MGLQVKELRLRDWRNFEERELAFGEGVTVLVGPNAAGKTNTVEALQLLTAGLSFRHPRPAQLVREGATAARAEARLEGDGRVIDVACEVAGERRSFSTNGKRCRSHDMPRSLMSVLFNPDDLSFVKGSSKGRRQELDDFGRQASAGYGKLLGSYQRALEQRNRLLKEDYPDAGLLDAWDVSLAAGAAALVEARLRLFARLQAKMGPIFGEISGGEELGLSYASRLDGVDGLSRPELEEAFAEAFAASRAEDLRRQMTCVGPHRDDLSFAIAGRDARAFGSQGQQRTVVLAWKMAEVEVACDVLGSRPLLLLDDVMSELDEARRAAVVSFVGRGIQTVVTTTNLGYFTPDLLDAAEVVSYDGR